MAMRDRVAIVTDTASDITEEQAAKWDVRLVRLKVVFKDGAYTCGTEMTSERFYERLLEDTEIPTTSQPSPAEFQEAFAAELASGRDVVCLTISSKLSGTYQSACSARAMFTEEEQERIHIFDTQNLCISQLLLVRVAVSMRDAGKTAQMIVETLERLAPRVRLVAMFDTLEYVAKGGRLPAGVAKAGKMLNIKPVIGCEKGKIVMLGMAKGSKNGKNMIYKALKKYGPADHGRPFQFGYTGLSDAKLVKYLKDNEVLYGTYSEDLPINLVGPSVGTHVGAGAIAFAYISQS